MRSEKLVESDAGINYETRAKTPRKAIHSSPGKSIEIETFSVIRGDKYLALNSGSFWRNQHLEALTNVAGLFVGSLVFR